MIHPNLNCSRLSCSSAIRFYEMRYPLPFFVMNLFFSYFFWGGRGDQIPFPFPKVMIDSKNTYIHFYVECYDLLVISSLGIRKPSEFDLKFMPSNQSKTLTLDPKWS